MRCGTAARAQHKRRRPLQTALREPRRHRWSAASCWRTTARTPTTPQGKQWLTAALCLLYDVRGRTVVGIAMLPVHLASRLTAVTSVIPRCRRADAAEWGSDSFKERQQLFRTLAASATVSTARGSESTAGSSSSGAPFLSRRLVNSCMRLPGTRPRRHTLAALPSCTMTR